MDVKTVRIGSVAALIIGLYVGSASAGDPVPNLKSGEFSQEPHSSMHMLLEKTLLAVDVLTVDVKFGKEIGKRLSEIASGKEYSKELGKQAADVAIKADDALVQLKFVRDVSLDQWMDGVFENLQQARDAGLISADSQNKVKNGLPGWFAALKDRGYKVGDRVLYRVKANSLRTAVVAANGDVLVDFTDNDEKAGDVVMANYFAPKSDFRDLLLKSLFK
jgi:hypothetical protein